MTRPTYTPEIIAAVRDGDVGEVERLTDEIWRDGYNHGHQEAWDDARLKAKEAEEE